MKMIGFDGGSSLCELGPVQDVVQFFECLDRFVTPVFPEKNWGLLTDRLYRRYLCWEELDEALILMMAVQEVFSRVQSSKVQWRIDDGSRLVCDQATLADVFIKYFECFNCCVESAKGFFDDWNIYQPVKIVISDLSEFMVDKNRPLENYDDLSGEPFWFR